MSNYRIISFDVLKCSGIFLVIWGHCLAALGCQSYETNSCFLFIYSFHMPLFMMIAGFFFAGRASQRAFSDIVRKKSVQLLLPAIIWGVIIASMSFVYRFHRGDEGLYVYFGKSLYATVWFLRCLFLCYIMGRLANDKPWGYVVTICLSQLMPIWKFEIMYPCFLAGVALNRYYSVFRQKMHYVTPVLLLIFAVGYLYFWNASLLKTQYIFIEQDSVFLSISHRIIRIVIGIAASTFLILLFDKLFNSEKSIRAERYLNSIMAVGKETLGIYILQDIIIMGLLSKFFRIGFCSEFVFSAVVSPVLSLIILFFCYRIVKLIKRSDKLASYLLGVL